MEPDQRQAPSTVGVDLVVNAYNWAVSGPWTANEDPSVITTLRESALRTLAEANERVRANWPSLLVSA